MVEEDELLQKTETPPPEPGSPDHPETIWSMVLTVAANRKPLSWLRFLRLDKLEQAIATLKAVPGHGEVAKFLTDRQKQQLTDLLSQVARRKLSIRLLGDDEAAAPRRSAADVSNPTAHEKALSLPLVRTVMEVFETDLIDVNKEAQEK